jgi:predicted Zn-dependent protease with MMP-like domain
LNPQLRDYFDSHLEQVLAGLPQRVHDLLAEVPLHVEDYPPDDILDQLGVARREYLCGLYTGVPIGERSVLQSSRLPDVVTIYRQGILGTATGPHGRIHEGELRRQIRITVLHELGHHHGLDEDELRDLGYG